MNHRYDQFNMLIFELINLTEQIFFSTFLVAYIEFYQARHVKLSNIKLKYYSWLQINH